jgi:hypothetical protein
MARLSYDQILAYTKAAFAPYECVPEFSDFHARFGYAVYREDDSRLVNENILTREIRESEDLERVLRAERHRMETSNNFTFSAWDGIPVQTDC